MAELKTPDWNTCMSSYFIAVIYFLPFFFHAVPANPLKKFFRAQWVYCHCIPISWAPALLPTTKVIKCEKKNILCHILWCVEGALKEVGVGSECSLLVTSLKTELAIKMLSLVGRRLQGAESFTSRLLRVDSLLEALLTARRTGRSLFFAGCVMLFAEKRLLLLLVLP